MSNGEAPPPDAAQSFPFVGPIQDIGEIVEPIDGPGIPLVPGPPPLTDRAEAPQQSVGSMLTGAQQWALGEVIPPIEIQQPGAALAPALVYGPDYYQRAELNAGPPMSADIGYLEFPPELLGVDLLGARLEVIPEMDTSDSGLGTKYRPELAPAPTERVLVGEARYELPKSDLQPPVEDEFEVLPARDPYLSRAPMVPAALPAFILEPLRVGIDGQISLRQPNMDGMGAIDFSMEEMAAHRLRDQAIGRYKIGSARDSTDIVTPALMRAAHILIGAILAEPYLIGSVPGDPRSDADHPQHIGWDVEVPWAPTSTPRPLGHMAVRLISSWVTWTNGTIVYIALAGPDDGTYPVISLDFHAGLANSGPQRVGQTAWATGTGGLPFAVPVGGVGGGFRHLHVGFCTSRTVPADLVGWRPGVPARLKTGILEATAVAAGRVPPG